MEKYFALIDQITNTVIHVSTVQHTVCIKNGVHDEQTGIYYLENVHRRSRWKISGTENYYDNKNLFWKETGTAERKNYAGPGYTWDQTRNAFIPPSPGPGHRLNEETCIWERV